MMIIIMFYKQIIFDSKKNSEKSLVLLMTFFLQPKKNLKQKDFGREKDSSFISLLIFYYMNYYDYFHI